MRKILPPIPPPRDEPPPTPPQTTVSGAAWRGARTAGMTYLVVVMLLWGFDTLFYDRTRLIGWSFAFQAVVGAPWLFLALCLLGPNNFVAEHLVLPCGAVTAFVVGALVGGVKQHLAPTNRSS